MKKSYFKYILALLMFGSNGIIAGFIELASYEIVLLRTLVGSLMLALIFVVKRERLTFYKHKKQFANLCLSGISMGASWMFLYEAYNRIGVGLATLIYYCGPVIVIALSPLLFGEKLTKIKIIGFFVVFLGMFLINSSAINEGKRIFGILCGLMSAVSYSLMVIFNKKSKDISGLENPMFQLLLSFFTVALFVGIKSGYSLHISHQSIIPILILGFVNTGIGCYLYFSSIQKLPVQTVAVLGYLEPVSAVLFSVIALNERMSAAQFTGMLMIITGAVISENTCKLHRSKT